MSFFTRAAHTALTGLAIFGFASAAFAHHVEQQPFVETESTLLLDAVRRTGHQVYGKADICEEGLLGVATSDKRLLICVDNHKGDMDEMADTIRHEALHLVQYCNNGATLMPEENDQFIDYAQEYLHWDILGYDPSAWSIEAEARVMAHFLDEHQVAQLLVKYCGGRS